MTTEKMFELANRKKMRFQFKGIISVEDLWDLSPKQLDAIYKDLNSQIKKVEEESLLQEKTSADEELTVKIEIVKYIVKVKLEEAKVKSEEVERKQKKAKIMEVLANKQDEALLNKSPEELQAMLNEMDK